MKSTRILLVEDHVLVREGVRMLFEREPELQVVGETGDPSCVLSLVAATRPDILVLDLDLAGRSGASLCEQMRVLFPHCRLLVLTASAHADTARRLLAAGVGGYVLKQEGSAVLLAAVGALRRGECFVCPSVRTALNEVTTLPTERERELMTLIARGFNNLHIANTLRLSLHTVRTHRKNLMAKLRLHNAADITAYAIKSGYVAEAHPPFLGFKLERMG